MVAVERSPAGAASAARNAPAEVVCAAAEEWAPRALAAARPELVLLNPPRTGCHSNVSDYDLFILKGVKAWIDPKQKSPKTIHHHGYGTFVVDGETIKLKSKMP